MISLQAFRIIRKSHRESDLDSRRKVRYNAVMKMLFIYLILVNVLSFLLMAEDKRRARRRRWRIPERTLFAVALLGGSLGSLVGMYLCHHKTKHWYFVLGMPIILVVQVIIAFWIRGAFHVA